ncbi:hypothetical protein LP417_16135 [Polaromonas sp. P1-6]|nr:hypothetical protein LP417_16135 [Polaromonas sp. P1-6]
MRRVAITGLGVVSAVGAGTPAFFASLLSARSGIRSIDIAFPTGTESVLAGAIDFDPDQHFPRARLLTMDRVSQFALVAGLKPWHRPDWEIPLPGPPAWHPSDLAFPWAPAVAAPAPPKWPIPHCWNKKSRVCAP